MEKNNVSFTPLFSEPVPQQLTKTIYKQAFVLIMAVLFVAIILVILNIRLKKGRLCGGITGADCPEGYSCKYDGNYPDASGVCIKIPEQVPAISDSDLSQGWYWGQKDQKKPNTPANWIFSGSGTKSDCWHKSEIECGIFTDYTLEKSEGVCENDTQCQWAGEGCGGGHGICTNNPEKYKNAITSCDIVESFPANRGYNCGCIKNLGKCGWKK